MPPIKTSFFRLLKIIIFSIKLVIIDQLAKWWLLSNLPHYPGYVMQVTEFFRLVYVWNYGISFGLFSEYYQHSNQILLYLNFGITAVLILMGICAQSFRAFIGFIFVIAGACGNIYDRIMHGAVFDFLDFHIAGYHFPAFNFADAFIFLGCIIIFYDHYAAGQRIKKYYRKHLEACRKELQDSGL